MMDFNLIKSGDILISKQGSEFLICDVDIVDGETMYNMIDMHQGKVVKTYTKRIFAHPVDREKLIEKVISLSKEFGLDIKKD